MNESQHHRGPDEGGLHLAPGVGLGHRRLSIIDLATGQQPLYNEDRSVVVVFNGEIYNYQELIAELSAAGLRVPHTQRHRSDRACVGARGASSCVDRFRGMFAFVLWDEKQQTALHGARSARREAALLRRAARRLSDCGSELKSLLAHGALARDDRSAAPSKNISRSATCLSRARSSAARAKLPPAHSLTVRRGAPVPAPREYWDVTLHASSTLSAERGVRPSWSSGCAKASGCA